MVFKKLRDALAPKPAPRPRRRLPKRELAPVAEIVEQGMMVADVAVRMTVKNKIIMRALKQQASYSTADTKEKVREALTDLIAERERDAENIEKMLTKINRFGYAAGGDTEYRSDDNSTLKHRQEVYQGVARQLRERLADSDYVAEIAQKATQLAWREVGESIANRAMHPYYSGGNSAEYQAARHKRIQDLIDKDLQQLLTERENIGNPVPVEAGWVAKLFSKKSQQ